MNIQYSTLFEVVIWEKSCFEEQITQMLEQNNAKRNKPKFEIS